MIQWRGERGERETDSAFHLFLGPYSHRLPSPAADKLSGEARGVDRTRAGGGPLRPAAWRKARGFNQRQVIPTLLDVLVHGACSRDNISVQAVSLLFPFDC